MAKKEAEKRDYTRLRERAEEFAVGQGMSGRDIAELLSVSEVTVSKWRKEGNWENKKKEIDLSPIRIKQKLLSEAQKIANGESSDIEADKLSKIVAAIDRLDKKISIRLIADVFREFDNWLSEIEPVRAVEFTKYHKLFLQYRISLEV